MPNSYDSHSDHKPVNEAGQNAAHEYTLEELLELSPSDFESLDLLRLKNTPHHTLAQLLERHKVDDRRTVLRLLGEGQASDILAEMDTEDTAETVGAMREWRALKILEELDSDDAADVLSKLSPRDRERLLDKLPHETAQIVRDLLRYDEDTAGGIMNPSVATVAITASVDEAIQHIRNLKDTVEHLHYIYALDDTGHLEGVLSIRDLLLAQPSQLISEIAHTYIKGVCKPEDDKEAVALALADLNLSALPVVDSERHLLGIVTYDDIIDVLQDEATEDIQRLVGAGPDESIHHSVVFSISRRSPWLFVNLLTACMAGTIVYCFQEQIERYTLLAVFTPIVASLGGNTGAQTLAVSIRSLALGEIQPNEGLWVCVNECFKGFLNGIPIGLVAGFFSWLVGDNFTLACVMFSACVLNMALAGTVGAFIPLFLKRLHCDPAQSSSIFLTAITDMSGFFLFLSLGSWLLL